MPRDLSKAKITRLPMITVMMCMLVQHVMNLPRDSAAIKMMQQIQRNKTDLCMY